MSPEKFYFRNAQKQTLAALLGTAGGPILGRLQPRRIRGATVLEGYGRAARAVALRGPVPAECIFRISAHALYCRHR
jgi:hypothetical protein